MCLILCVFFKKTTKNFQIKENTLLMFVFKSGLCSYVFLFKINLDLKSCEFLFLIMFLIFFI